MQEALGSGRENGIVGQGELSRANELLEGSAPQKILRWAVDVYGKDLTISISFGNPEGMVLLDMLSRITDEVQVFTLDTGFLFEETVRFREEAMKRYPLPLEVVTPGLTVEEQVERYGSELYSCAPDLCCEVRKIEPQRRFLKDYGAWVTGIRRDQTHQRAFTPVVTFDEYFGVAKIAPLAAWSEDDIDAYVRHGLPQHRVRTVYQAGGSGRRCPGGSLARYGQNRMRFALCGRCGKACESLERTRD
jgi:phosphoadenosine phosphosulfate reductase